ncbi:MAG: OmpA family protein, partial [Chitinophagales bacterium]
MQKLFIYLLLFISCNAAIAQTVHHQTSVYFDKDKAELTIEAQNDLTSTLQSIFNLETYSLKIEAHTDNDGSLTYNQLLSEKRANAVYSFLLLQGMNTQDLQIVAEGETNPAFSNQTKTGQQQNRRVDVFFVSKSAELQITKAPIQPKVETFEDLKRLTTTNILQSFPINTAKEQKIEGRKGTILTIPPNAFVLEDGSELPTHAKVEIELQEALDLEDMLLNNLSTQSGERFLETGGMVRIEANYQGEKLKLKSDKNIEVNVPKNGISATKEKDMELFYGVAQEGNAMDWKPTNEKVKATPPHPKVEIDIAELENLNLTKLSPPKLHELQALTEVPKKVSTLNKPYKPHAPRQPEKNRYKYKPTSLEKLVYSKKKIETLSEQKFQEAMTKYEKRKAEYDIRWVKYEDDWENYNKVLAENKEWMSHRKNIIMDNIITLDTLRRLNSYYKEYVTAHAALQHLKDYILKKGLTLHSPEKVYAYIHGKTKSGLKPIDAEFIANHLKISSGEASMTWAHYNNKKNYRDCRMSIKKITNNYSTEDVENLVSKLTSKYFKKKQEMGIFTNEDFNYFTTSVSQMGWINIDRWLKQQEKQEVIVLAEKDENTRFFAISHRFNSCLSSGRKSKNGM